MDKVDEMTSPPAACQRHCFPDLHGQPHRDDGQNGPSCLSFQPLFCDAADQSISSGQKADGPAVRTNADDSALEQKYRQGFKAGESDACRMVQEGLAPHVRVFGDCLKTLSGDLERLLSESGPSITTLAVAIAEKILGKSAQKDENDASKLKMLQQRLQQDLTAACRMELMMNPADFRVLTSLMECPKKTEKHHPVIPISTSPELERGAIREIKAQWPKSDEWIVDIIEKPATPIP